MKAKGLLIAVVGGLLAVSSASAFPYWNNATYAARFGYSAPAPASNVNTPFQVAVMATSPAPSTGERQGLVQKVSTNLGPRYWGPPRPFAVKSR